MKGKTLQFFCRSGINPETYIRSFLSDSFMIAANDDNKHALNIGTGRGRCTFLHQKAIQEYVAGKVLQK